MKTFDRHLYMLLITIFFMFFQNCGFPLNFGDPAEEISDNKGSESTESIQQDKILKVYQHNIPNYTCGGERAAFQEIKFYEDRIVLIQNINEQCGVNRLLSREDIELSDNKSLIFYNNSIFKMEFESLEGTFREPSILSFFNVEVWCRSSPDASTYVDLVIFGRVRASVGELKTSKLRMTQSNTNESFTKDLYFNRMIEGTNLYYSNDKFKLRINAGLPLEEGSNHFNAVIEGGTMRYELVCRLGNDQDPIN